jgi:hypothetical protein
MKHPGGGGGGGGALILSAYPPPKGFQTVLAPTEIPAGIPAVDLEQGALDPRDFTGSGVEGLEPAEPISQPMPRFPVASAVFRPARLGPYPVRQLTKQPVRFIASQ